MKDELISASGDFPALLPECRAGAEALAELVRRFGMDSGHVRRASGLLAEHHNLAFSGVRRLTAACVDELCGCLLSDGLPLVEVAPPAPLSLIMALQHAARGRFRFTSAAFFSQFFLRGLMLESAPLDYTSCAKRRCGLNIMRGRLLNELACGKFALTVQFGSLCDECVKTGEQLSALAPAVSCTLPRSGCGRPGCTSSLLERAARRICGELGLRLSDVDMEYAAALYSRLMRAEARLTLLNARRDRVPLYGNSFALAQSVQLMCFDDQEAVISALEGLADELEHAAEAVAGRKRLYCFYTPFLRPGIAARFRAAGVDLMGSAVFLSRPFNPGGGIYSLSAGALLNSLPALDVREEARMTAGAVRFNGCDAYLTGSFAFDRRMGSAAPLLRKLLREEYGVPSFALESDFWCETGSPFPPTERVDAICSMLN